MTRVGLDTNILVYFVGIDRGPEDAGRIVQTRDLIGQLRERATLIAPLQMLGELFVVMSRAGLDRQSVADKIGSLTRGYETAPTLQSTFAAGAAISASHKLQFWDSIILAAALESGCTLFLSEDMQDGFVIRGMTIVNPFSAKPNTRLAELL